MFFHSSSYTANPLACAAAAANIAIWQDEPVIGRVGELAERQARHLEKLAQKPRITNARRAGTIAAVEIEDSHSGYLSDLGPKLLSRFRQSDVLLRPLGNTVYVMPPYCISDEDLASIYDGIEDAVVNC